MRFPNDRKITVLDCKLKPRKEWQSYHLMKVHKWTESEVRVMQMFGKNHEQ
jgi:hypothetical protein